MILIQFIFAIGKLLLLKFCVYYSFFSAAAHTKLGNHVQALDDCKIAIQHDPNYSKAYCRMGLAYVNLNDHQKARDCYKKAVELDPSESNLSNLNLSEQKLQVNIIIISLLLFFNNSLLRNNKLNSILDLTLQMF